MLGAEFRLPSVTSEDAAPDKKAPISLKFEIPYFTVSGIQVCASGWLFAARVLRVQKVLTV